MFRLRNSLLLGVITWCAACSTPEPTTLASGQDIPWGIAVHGDSVYFSEHGGGAIMRVGTNGGALRTLTSGQLSPAALATDGQRVYWANSDGSIMTAPVGGGTAAPLATDQNGADAVVTDGVNVYFVGQGSQGVGAVAEGAVMQVPVGGGAPVALVSNVILPSPLALDETNVYFMGAPENSVSWNLMSVPIGGGSTTLLAGGLFEPVAMAVDAANVYWEAGVRTDNDSIDSFVMKVAKTGGSVTTLAPLSVGNLHNAPTGFAVDASSVYFVDSDFWKVPIEGGAAVPFALGAGGDVGGFALDAKSVYWTSPVAGKVSKTPKSP